MPVRSSFSVRQLQNAKDASSGCYPHTPAASAYPRQKEKGSRFVSNILEQFSYQSSDKNTGEIACEAVGHAVRKDAELQRFYQQKLVQKGLGKAKVAAARKLGIRLWILLRDQIDYQEFCRRGQLRQRSAVVPMRECLLPRQNALDGADFVRELSRTSSCQLTVWQELAHFGLSNRAPFFIMR